MENLSYVKQNFINYVDKLIENNKVSHSYIVEIDNYDDDFIYIKNFIKMILCNIRYNELSSCDNQIIKLIDNDSFPDIKIIEPEGTYVKKHQLIDLQKEFSNKSLFNTKKIYIIKNAEKLNASSANTILKFLEEPENDIIALLLTDNRYHVLDTILSRCQTLILKEDKFLFDENQDIYDLLECIVSPNDFFIRYNYFINNIIVDKNIALEKFKIIENILIKYLDNNFCKNENFSAEIVDILSKVDNHNILKIISTIENCLYNLDYNVNYKLWLDSFFSKILIGG